MSLEIKPATGSQNIPMDGHPGGAIAYLGQLALSDPDPADLFANTAALIAHLLPADLVLIWEVEPTQEQLVLRFNSSRTQHAAVETRRPFEQDSFEGHVLHSSDPIVVHDLTAETRFSPPRYLTDLGATSGLCIRVGTDSKPLGLMLCFQRQPQSFSQNDIHFLMGIANTLALFIKSKRLQAQCLSAEEQRRKQKSAPPSTYTEWDHHEIQKRLVESRERERLRLAQELHDIPIQDLYGLIYRLDDLQDVLKNSEGAGILDDCNQILHRVVDNLRTLCGELRPPSLSPFGLEVAIRDHVEKIHKQFPEVLVHLDLMRDQQVLSDNLRVCLFRIYQQAINNVLRHAQASDVYIRFRWDQKVVILEVEDNGRGFDIPQQWVDLVRQGHFGLVGLAERVKSVEGKLEIVSAVGDGTLIRVIVPRHEAGA